MHMLWYNDLFVGEKARRKKNRIIWKLQHGAGMVRVYVLMMASNPDNSLDIINAAYLQQPIYKRRELRIVGIAISYDEALDLLNRIVMEVYEQTGGADIRGYLDSRNKFRKWRV